MAAISKTGADRLKRILKSVLEEQGVYNPSLDTLIESCAQLKVLRDAAYQQIVEIGLVVNEPTREGFDRWKPNPAVVQHRESAKELRNVLDELLMTAKRGESNDTKYDPLSELDRRMKEEIGI